MNAQEIFDHVVNHAIKQKKKSKQYRKCTYRGTNGESCFAGCLFTDEEYSSKMEFKDIHGVHQNGLLPKRLEGHVSLIYELQQVHDQPAEDASMFSEWANMFESTAAMFHLSFDRDAFLYDIGCLNKN